ncbi:MAG: Gldg family protein [Synergistaceae bacterium]|jgi:ABC-type transport system involved in multi-copper enzyme maturation permease subunit|nr:Gldg family protein [Synergistaceae bacterium]
MRGTLQKELRTYFSTISGYAFAAVFTAISGAMFVMTNLMPANGDIKSFFSSFFPSIMFLIPILTMRLYAEERKMKTDELILTSPVRTSDIVAGKFLAAFAVFAGCLALAAVFPLILARRGASEPLAAIGGYAGMAMLGASLIAIGLFISVRSENQIAAATLTYAVFLALHIAGGAKSAVGSEAIAAALSALSPTGRFIRFANGIFDPADAIFFLSVTAIFLYMSARDAGFTRMGPAQRRRSRVILALSLCLFFLTNACASLSSKKFDLALDMTGDKLYSVSRAALESAGRISAPVTLTVFSGESDFPDAMAEMLRRFAGAFRNVIVKYADPYENPLLVDHYRQMGHSPGVSDILVEGDSGARLVKYDDLFVRRGGEAYGIQLEQRVVSAMRAVSSGEGGTQKSAAFTMGHNERPSAALRNLFSSNGYETWDAYVGQGIDPGVGVVVVAGPARDFAPDEADALASYLSEGGKVMAFIGPGEARFDNLGALLAGRGIALMDDMVVEERAYAAGSPINIIPRYAPHSINLYFADNPYYVVMPASRGFEIRGGSAGAGGAEAVLVSTSGSFAAPSAGASEPQGASRGPFAVAAIAERAAPSGRNQALFAAGSIGMYADGIMETQAYANRDFLASVLNYLTDGDTAVSIPPKTIAPPAIAVTWGAIAATGSIFVMLLPAAMLAGGAFICASRRRR